MSKSLKGGDKRSRSYGCEEAAFRDDPGDDRPPNDVSSDRIAGDVFSSFPFEGILGLAFPSLSFGGIEPFFERVIKAFQKAYRSLLGGQAAEEQRVLLLPEHR